MTDDRKIVIIGAGPAGPDRRVHAVQARRAEHGARVRHRRRRHQPDGDAPTAGASTSAATASSRRCSPSRTSGSRSSGPTNFLKRPRLSRIYYRGKFYDYPISRDERAANLGLDRGRALRGSYVWVRIHPPKDKSTLEGFVASRFGWRLYEHFFKTQSEKVWGVPVHGDPGRLGRAAHQESVAVPSGVGSAQAQAVRKAPKSKQVTSLIEEFNYPKYGPGMMWERCAEIVDRAGHQDLVRRDRRPRSSTQDGRAVAVTAASDGVPTRYECTDVISSMPIGALLRAMDPPVSRRRASPPPTACATATSSPSRSWCPRRTAFPDNWIYINDTIVEVGRIQNFGRVVAVHGEGRAHVPRARVLRERGRRHVDEVRRRPDRAGQARAATDRASSTRRRSRTGTSSGCRRRTRCTTRPTRTTSSELAEWIAEHTPERVSGRPQRHAPVQQPGPLDAHRDAVGREHLRREPRRVDRERRGGVPRGEGRRPAAPEPVTARGASGSDWD